MLAQTLTADALPHTGVDAIDRALAVAVLTLTAITSFLAVARQLQTRVKELAQEAADLFGSAKAVVAGVEVSRRDIAEVLMAECPSLPNYRIDEIAAKIHDKLTARIEKVSNARQVEPVLSKIVKETKSELKALDPKEDVKP